MGQRRNQLDAVLVALVAVPLLYVLSIGPAARFHDLLHLQPSVAIAVYSPIIWCAEHEHHAGWVLEAYLRAWGAM